MSVMIRMQRRGKLNKPFFHIVALDKRRAPNFGEKVELLGYYDPTQEPSVMEFNAERVQYWYSKGANVSPAIAKMCKIKKIALEREKTHTGKKAKSK